jgi:drug/metabolite transporter (DMT)-like permease
MVFAISPFFWALAAAAGISAWSLLSRHIMRNEKDYLAVAVINENLSALVLIGALLVLGPGWLASAPIDFSSIPPLAWGALAVAIVLYTASGLLSYQVFQKVEASERAVVSQAQIIWVVALGALLLSEPVGPATLLAAGLIVAGALLCTYRPGKHRWDSPGVRLTLVVALIYGTATLADKLALGYFPPLLYSLPMYLFPGLAALALLGNSIRKRAPIVLKRYGARFLLFSALSILPYFAYLLALRELPASAISPLVSTNVVLTALGGMLLLGEHDGWKQKIAGALMAFAGAWMMGGG